MKKFILAAIFFWMLTASTNIFAQQLDEQLDNYNFEDVNALINGQQDYKFDFGVLIRKIISGDFDFANLFEFAQSTFFSEFKNNMRQAKGLIILIILSALIKNLADSFQIQSVSEIAFYVSYIVISINLFSTFKISIGIAQDLLQTILQLLQISLPLVISLLTMSGNFYASNIFNPVIFLFADAIVLIINFMLPLVTMFVSIQIINNMTGKNLMTNFAQLIKTIVSWSLKIISLSFMGVLTLQRISAPLLEGATAKTAKLIINVVPLVGEVFTGAVDSVISWAHLIKNAAMVVLVIGIFFVCMASVIKLGIFALVYKILSALVQPISDERIVKCTQVIFESSVLLLSCCFTAIVVFLFALMIFTSL